MNCVICRHGVTEHGTVTVTLEHKATTLVFKNVPALVCLNCGEAYLDETISENLLALAQSAVQAGVQIEVRNYAVA